jgi:hypothetical protein
MKQVHSDDIRLQHIITIHCYSLGPSRLLVVLVLDVRETEVSPTGPRRRADAEVRRLVDRSERVQVLLREVDDLLVGDDAFGRNRLGED